jgi:iron complex transport system substrate-binding protein
MKPTPLTRRMIFAALGLALGACTLANTPQPAAAEGIVVRDSRGRDVAVGATQRVVSIGGAITEILYALGLEARIVGVDTSSLYPPQALKDKPNVGYMRALSAEGVLGLNPQVIFAMEGSGPKEALEVLEAANVPFVSFPETFTEQGLIDKIRLVAHAMDADARGACLAAAVSRDLTELRTLRDAVKRPARVMFVMSFVNGRAMVAGQKTAANEIIKLAGGVNAMDGFDGYKTVNDEAIVAAKPDVVLAMQRERDPLNAAAVFTNPSFALTPAAARKSFVAMDGLYLLGFGPRTAAAARDLAVSLYPELADKAAGWKPAALSVDCRK